MQRSLKLAVVALAATTLLAAALSSASARNLSVSTQNIRATWASLEFETGVGILIRCPVTLEGSFHSRTIAKVERLLIGAITRAISKQEACTRGIAATFNGVERYNGVTPANTLPWHITFESFSGELPNITSVRLLFSRFRFGIRDTEALCTGQYGKAEDNISLSAALTAGTVTSLTPVEGRNIAHLSMRDGGVSCPNTIALRGSGSVMVLNNTTQIRVTLI